MANFRFELNYAGVGQLLKSDEAMGVCRDFAQEIAGRAGDGYELSEYTDRTRVNVSVYAATKEAVNDCYDNNSLLKALGG